MTSLTPAVSPETTTPVVASVATMSALDKQYGPTHAVRAVSLALRSDQVTAVMGGNGAGKSTLMRMLAGETVPDSGTLQFDDRAIDFEKYTPRSAHALGIRVVHQELSLADSLTVAENFYVEHGATGRSLSWRRGVRRIAREAIESSFGTETGIRVDAKVSSLSVAQRQIVEIARAVSAPNLRMVILDEPTSAMGREYLGHMERLVKTLRDSGVIVVVITHKMYELPVLADRVVVLREGRLVADMPVADATESALIEWMTGTAAAEANAARVRTLNPAADDAKVIVSAEGLSAGILRDVTMRVRAGEVVGLAGLQGAGQVDLLRAVLAGSANNLEVNGSVAYVTGDRRDEGVFPLWSSRYNLAISALSSAKRVLPFGRTAIAGIAEPWLRRLRLPVEADDKTIISLSGGMQQKILIARGLSMNADLLLLNDPTRGVDVTTKQDLYRLIREAADNGKGVLWCSSEDMEAGQCDRVYVMAGGTVVQETTGAEITQEGLIAASFATSDASAAEPEPAPRSAPVAVLQNVLRQPWFLAVVGLIATFSVIVSQQPIIASYGGLELVLSLAPVLAMVGLGQMFVIALGDIDLGMGAYLGYVGVVAATALVSDPLLGVLLLVGGVAIYPLVGLLITKRNIPPIVATLGMSFVWLGLALTIQPTVGGTVPQWLIDTYSAQTPLFPAPVWALVIAALAGYFIAIRTRLGTLIRAVGSNPQSVTNAGWNILAIRMIAYAIAGLFAGIAGLLFAAVATSGDANGTSGYTLIAIAAAIIGGCFFSGGRISPVGVVVAGVMLTLVAILLSTLSVPPVFTAASQGALLLLVMGIRRVPIFHTEAN